MSKYPFLFQKDVRLALIDSKDVQKTPVIHSKNVQVEKVQMSLFFNGFCLLLQAFILSLLFIYNLYYIYISAFPASAGRISDWRLPSANISFFSYVECFPDGKQGCCLWQQKLLVIRVLLMPIKCS